MLFFFGIFSNFFLLLNVLIFRAIQDEQVKGEVKAEVKESSNFGLYR